MCEREREGQTDRQTEESGRQKDSDRGVRERDRQTDRKKEESGRQRKTE